MTLTIELSTELQRQLDAEAQRLGKPPEEVALHALTEHLHATDERRKTIEILQSWIDEDAPEDSSEDPDEFLKELDANRQHDVRKLYPHLGNEEHGERERSAVN